MTVNIGIYEKTAKKDVPKSGRRQDVLTIQVFFEGVTKKQLVKPMKLVLERA